MTAPLSAQSAIEILESEWHTGDSVQALIVLRRVVKDYASLRAENERLREQHKTDEGVNLRLCEMHTNQQKELHNLGKAYKKAEAELAKQAPLIEAVMGLDEIDFIADDWPSEKLRESADKLRSEK